MIVLVAAVAFAAMSADASVASFPSSGFAGAKVVREKGAVNVLSPGKKVILNLRVRPFDNAAAMEGLKVEVDDDGVTIDPKDAFAAGALDIVLDTYTSWPRDDLSGQDCLFVSELGGDGANMSFIVYGTRADRKSTPFTCRKELPTLRRRRHPYECPVTVPKDVVAVSLRYLMTSPGKGPVRWHGGRIGRRDDIETAREPYGEPELLFHAGFDSPGARADFSKGSAEPVKIEGVEFVDGGGRRGGGAMLFGGGGKGVLSYCARGIVRPYCGTVAFWAKMSPGAMGVKGWRKMFSLKSRDGREGAGDIVLGWYGPSLNIQRGDFAKSGLWLDEKAWRSPEEGWHHWVFVWSDTHRMPARSIFCDGQSVPPGNVPWTWRPTAQLSALPDPMDFDRKDGDFETFSIGSDGGAGQFRGLIDDVRIYSAPMDVYAVRRLFDSEREVDVVLSRTFLSEGEKGDVVVSARFSGGRAPDNVEYAVWDEGGREVARSAEPSFSLKLAAGAYTVGIVGHGGDPMSRAPLWVLKKGNARALKPQRQAGVPGRRRLVAEWKAGESTLEEMEREKRFRAVGRCSFGELAGRRYLETGSRMDDRFALRFEIDASKPLYCFEFDYPDDKARTAEIIVEPTRGAMLKRRYEMQCGYACGGEFALTGRMLTHRVLYWTVTNDVVAIVRSLHAQPAAVAAVRIYELLDSGLPAAMVPPSAGTTPRRSFAHYSEDVSLLSYCFGVNQSTAQSFNEDLERLAAVMKYCGQDTLVYPGVWYHGAMKGSGAIFNPHAHARDFVQGIFEKFDHEGLGFMPLVNRLDIGYPRRLMTRQRMRDGSFHDSPISIFDTGLPNRSSCATHEASDYNVHHPLVQKAYLDDVELMVAYGRGHRSFKGVCIHLAKYSPGWYGGLESGYNDYSVDAFARATGIKVPGDRSDPLRGKAYADWIRANCLERWIDWRCDVLADFYAKVAERLRTARPDLKLWLNCWPHFFSYPGRPDIMEDGVASRMFREYGIDGAKLKARIPNLVLGTMDIPMWSRDEWPQVNGRLEAKLRARDMAGTADFYRETIKGGFPAVAHFDSYFESAVGLAAGVNSLTCDWMQDHPWRVAALNPSGRNVLMHYAVPLKFTDVMLFSKGGFLFGNYGTEEVLAPWMQNFRALPAVPFKDVESPSPDVTVREGFADGVHYVYAVNTSPGERRVKLCRLEGFHEMVSGQSATRDVVLAPYELRSYCK